MKQTCKMCDKAVSKIRTEQTNARGAIFVDETGKQWYGRTCPTCRYNNNRHDLDVPPRETYLDGLSADMEDSVYC